MSKQQKILAFVLVLFGAAALLFFGMRAFRAANKMRGHGPFGKPPAANSADINLIRDWMTVPYIAKMYDVPPEALFRSLDLGSKQDFIQKEYDKMSLKELNDELYPDQPDVILNHVRAAIQAMQLRQRPPDFPATPQPLTPPAAPSAPAAP